MGQRLVLNVYKTEKSVENNENILCSIYYHWNGYTYNGIINTIKFYNSYSKYSNKYDDEVAIVLSVLNNTDRFRIGTYGGVAKADHGYFKNKYNDKYPDIVDKVMSKNDNRSLGLVGFTKDTKDIINDVGEMFITLCLDQDSEIPRPWINIEGACCMVNDEEDTSEYRYELEFDNIQKVYLDTIRDDELTYKLLYGAKITSKHHGTIYKNI